MKELNFSITRARVWRGDGEALEALTSPLRVREGRFVEAPAPPAPSANAPAPSANAPERARDAIDLGDRVIVPGLIDAHVHLELDPALKSPKEQLAVPEPARRAAMARRAGAMLAAGITTTRDCGGGGYMEHDLRGEIDAGRVPGPRLLCCGRPITTPGGHCHFWGGEVDGEAAIDERVGEQIEAGSDWVKVMATGGVFTPGGARARDTQFDEAALRRVVDAAAAGGRSVAAHCHGTAGIALAARAGVRTIEHASFAGERGFGTDLDLALMREMAASELWVSPTVNAGWGRRRVDEGGQPTGFFTRMSTALRAQRDHGIRFIASTDAGIPGVVHSELVAGLEAFAAFADLRPVDVLRAATSESARALGLASETGRIAPGLFADFLVLDADPLEDLSALRDPAWVVIRGRWLDREARAALSQVSG